MKLKFPDLTQIHCQFENPDKLKVRAKEISSVARKMIQKFQEPMLFMRLKDRILDIWRT
jgi:hypothetical protein